MSSWDDWNWASFFGGMLLMFFVGFAALGHIAMGNRETGWNVGYLSGQVDALNGKVSVSTLPKEDKTSYWAATQPVKMDNRDYRKDNSK